MPTHAEVDSFFRKTMRFPKVNLKKHDAYEPSVNGTVAVLPPLTLSRGSGEVPHRNLRGLADNMGVSERTLIEGIRGNIQREVFLMTLLSKSIHVQYSYVASSFFNDPNIVYADRVLGLEETVKLFLAEIIAKALPWKPIELRYFVACYKLYIGEIVKANIKHDPVHFLQPRIKQWLETAKLDSNGLIMQN